MPHLPVTKCLLGFFGSKSISQETDVLEMLPWTNVVWRDLLDISDVNSQVGIVLSNRKLKGLPQKYRDRFDSARQLEARRFLEEMRKRTFETGGVVSAIRTANHITGYSEYRDIVDTLLTGAGGCMDVVWSTMEACSCTPARALMDVRKENEVSW
jgi:hypothetical protein